MTKSPYPSPFPPPPGVGPAFPGEATIKLDGAAVSALLAEGLNRRFGSNAGIEVVSYDADRVTPNSPINVKVKPAA